MKAKFLVVLGMMSFLGCGDDVTQPIGQKVVECPGVNQHQAAKTGRFAEVAGFYLWTSEETLRGDYDGAEMTVIEIDSAGAIKLLAESDLNTKVKPGGQIGSLGPYGSEGSREYTIDWVSGDGPMVKHELNRGPYNYIDLGSFDGRIPRTMIQVNEAFARAAAKHIRETKDFWRKHFSGREWKLHRRAILNHNNEPKKTASAVDLDQYVEDRHENGQPTGDRLYHPFFIDFKNENLFGGYDTIGGILIGAMMKDFKNKEFTRPVFRVQATVAHSTWGKFEIAPKLQVALHIRKWGEEVLDAHFYPAPTSDTAVFFNVDLEEAKRQVEVSGKVNVLNMTYQGADGGDVIKRRWGEKVTGFRYRFVPTREE